MRKIILKRARDVNEITHILSKLLLPDKSGTGMSVSLLSGNVIALSCFH